VINAYDLSRPTLQLSGFNGTSPGPVIIVNAGDRIIATVKNVDVDEGTAIHWHGIRHTLSNNMDGVVEVTQYGIKMGETFKYDFLVDGPGTFWYHTHFATQYMAGARAALIVLDPTETMYEDRIVLVADWYHDVSINCRHAVIQGLQLKD
jgi:iron transport multicopper oxidase